MTAKEILEEIKPLGRESYRKVLFNHGIPEPCFGVKIEELKKIQFLEHSQIQFRIRFDRHQRMLICYMLRCDTDRHHDTDRHQPPSHNWILLDFGGSSRHTIGNA